MISPMLATPTRPPAPYVPGWVVQPKWDGVRLLGGISPDGPVLWTREGQIVTWALPELVSLLEGLPRGTVLDGELVERGPSGAMAEDAALARLAGRPRRASTGYRWALFDCPSAPGVLGSRLRALMGLVAGASGPARIMPSWPMARAGEALQRALAMGWEGLVAKRIGSEYRAGRRTADWRKWRLCWGIPPGLV